MARDSPARPRALSRRVAELRNKTITRMFGGNARYGCYALAVTIFVLGLVRDSLYTRALQAQPVAHIFPGAPLVGAALFVAGQTLVLSSTWALGVTGTFLGDYFGILLDARVQGFPFSVVRDPMYTGSTMCFAAAALWWERPAGLLLTLYVHVMYVIALRFEGPYTDAIYARRAAERAAAAKKDI